MSEFKGRPRITCSKGRELAQKSSPASATLTLTVCRGEVVVIGDEGRGWSARQAPTTTITQNNHIVASKRSHCCIFVCIGFTVFLSLSGPDTVARNQTKG